MQGHLQRLLESIISKILGRAAKSIICRLYKILNVRAMNKRGLFVAFLWYAIAQLSPAKYAGYYEFIPYYNNAPFTSYTVGAPTDCRMPVNPATGT